MISVAIFGIAWSGRFTQLPVCVGGGVVVTQRLHSTLNPFPS
jgi:hypothetical protein